MTNLVAFYRKTTGHRNQIRRRVGSAAVASPPDTKAEQKMSKPQSAIFGRSILQYLPAKTPAIRQPSHVGGQHAGIP